MGHQAMLAREKSILEAYEQCSSKVCRKRGCLVAACSVWIVMRAASLGAAQGQVRLFGKEERTCMLE